ncbi:MAG: alpha/beta hydrolase [Balneolales bacterium]|nr:alpha/beta hydrolase [Balneolales bacterium]
MKLFRVDPKNPFVGPHQNQPLLQAGADPARAKAAMIMIHGRGASPESILSLANEIEANSQITFFAPTAYGNTWYPYSFLVPPENNQPFLNSAIQAVGDVVTKVESLGVSKDKIFLLGFSQGACLAQEYAARHPQRYAGIVGFSGGMIGDQIHKESFKGSLEGTPYFLGCSDIDGHVPIQRLHETSDVFEKLGANVTKVIYPGMGHLINEDEITHLNKMVNSVVAN